MKSNFMQDAGYGVTAIHVIHSKQSCYISVVLTARCEPTQESTCATHMRKDVSN